MNVYVIYQRYLDEREGKPIIGGLQTYTENLCALLLRMGYPVTVLQFSDFAFEKRLDNGTIVLGVEKKHKNHTKDLLAEAEKRADLSRDLLIFLTSTQVLPNRFAHSLCIQHGIYWDVPTIRGRRVGHPLDTLLRCVQSLQIQKQMAMVKKTVCVDYNYINWLRTQTTGRELSYEVIPNFTVLAPLRERQGEGVRIAFSRRFEEIRGVRLMETVMPRILREFPCAEFTAAGGGRLQQELETALQPFSERVTFTRYAPGQSLEFHSEFDIALVPTIGSEGTSLSLLEAMAAGCAVICTDVGGMTNIVLDGYNALMVRPDEECLYEAIRELIIDPERRRELALKGRECAGKAFSHEGWEKKWEKVILSEDTAGAEHD